MGEVRDNDNSLKKFLTEVLSYILNEEERERGHQPTARKYFAAPLISQFIPLAPPAVRTCGK